MNCNRCGGTMMANMEAKYQGKDDGYEVACMLCGYDNAPPVSLEQVRQRDRLPTMPKGMMMGNDGSVVPRIKGRPTGDGLSSGKTAAIDKDGVYSRFLGAITRTARRFIVKDVAAELGVASSLASSCARRAHEDGWVREVGVVSWANPTKVWESVPNGHKQKSQAS